MAKSKVADAAKAKQAKQKKMVILLACVFVLAIGYAVNTMMGMKGGGAKPVAASASVTASSSSSTTATAAPNLSGSTTPSSTPTSTPTSTPSSSPDSTTTTPTDSSQLVAVVTPPMDPGQLQSFGNFASKDPFDSAGPGTTKATGTSGSSGSGSGSGGTSGGTSGGSTPKTPPAPPAAPTTSAVISVNGTEESVTAGSDFPSTNPIFLLQSVTATQARVSIAGGSYATGQPALTLTVNKPVTLVNTADGTRYTLILLPQGTVVPPTSSSSAAPSTTSTTTTPTGP